MQTTQTILISITEAQLINLIEEAVERGVAKAFSQIEENQNTSKLVSIREASALLGISKPTCYAWIKKSNGRIVKHKMNGSSKTFYKISEIMAELKPMEKFKR